MFREIKKEARKILFKNYKYFIFPTILHILTNCIISACCYFIFYNDGLKNWATPQFWLWILFFLLAYCVVLPLAKYLLFKVPAMALNNIPIKFEFSFSKLIKVILIYLPLIIFGFISLFLDGLAESELYANYGLMILFFSALINIFEIYFEYKLFAAFYHFALNEGTAKETIEFSYNLMHKKFWLTVFLSISLVLWLVIAFALGIIIIKLPGMNDLLRMCLASANYGVNFIFLPYLHAVRSVFIKKQIEKSV
jgi:hypothetical protein